MESLELFGKTVLPEFAERDEKLSAEKEARLAPIIEKVMARKPESRSPAAAVARLLVPGHRPGGGRAGRGRRVPGRHRGVRERAGLGHRAAARQPARRAGRAPSSPERDVTRARPDPNSS